MAEAEFQDLTRINLLTALKAALTGNFSSTVRAYLWLCDIDILTRLVNEAQREPFFVEAALDISDIKGKSIEKCEFINFYIFS
jgi:hypothetical protein